MYSSLRIARNIVVYSAFCALVFYSSGAVHEGFHVVFLESFGIDYVGPSFDFVRGFRIGPDTAGVDAAVVDLIRYSGGLLSASVLALSYAVFRKKIDGRPAAGMIVWSVAFLQASQGILEGGFYQDYISGGTVSNLFFGAAMVLGVAFYALALNRKSVREHLQRGAL